MPTKRTAPEYPKPGLVGPADTDDPTVRVSSTNPAPTEQDRRTGRTPAAVAVDPPRPAPLRLAGEHRTETYELLAPGNVVVDVTHNLDTGATEYVWTDRTELAP
jgi:hypothetical protein